jgi:site-specific DNA-methyltransferase (adenine-specific)
LTLLNHWPSQSVDLIYIDPPFNTGKTRSLVSIAVQENESGLRKGFGGKRYTTIEKGSMSYLDSHDNYLEFLLPRFREAYRVLKRSGTLYVHLDYREAHYCKVALDNIFDRECFLNEIVWAYDYGARSKTRWPTKHDTILVYVKDIQNYVFNYSEMERLPYMAPSLVGEAKAKQGKTPTDVWWQTIVGTNSKERTGYPTQKPIAIIKRIIKVSSNEGDLVMDFFAGSGTVGAACLELNRNFVLVDENIQAIEVMRKRFADYKDIVWKTTDEVTMSPNS